MSAGSSGSGEGVSHLTENQLPEGAPAWEDESAARVLAGEARLEDDRVSYWLQDAMTASRTASSIVLDSARDTVMLVCPRAFRHRMLPRCNGCVVVAITLQGWRMQFGTRALAARIACYRIVALLRKSTG